MNRGLSLGMLLLLSACGGGGGDATVTPVPNAMVGGLWGGTLTVNGVAYNVAALSAENGEMELLESDLTFTFAAQYWGTISAVGNQLSGAFTGAVLNPAVPFSDGSTRGTGTVSGTISQRSSINATVSFTTSMGAVVPGQLALTYDASYATASSLTTISGNFTSTGTAAGTDTLSITTGGVITYSDPTTTGCMATGAVSIINSSYALYAGQLTLSNCTGNYMSLNGVSVQGLGGLDPTQSPEALVFLMHGIVNGLDAPLPFIMQRT
jgi:hypothetical protein